MNLSSGSSWLNVYGGTVEAARAAVGSLRNPQIVARIAIVIEDHFLDIPDCRDRVRVAG